MGCAEAQPRFAAQTVAGAAPNTRLTLLRRAALATPLRYRVAFIPGSGCSGLAPIADAMFAGLLHAEVWVLHKPGVDVWAGAAPPDCPPGFAAHDDLPSWLAHAQAALQTAEQLLAAQDPGSDLPWVLVGASEGAELLAFLAPVLPRLKAMVTIGGSGLNPVEAGAMQAQRLGEMRQWQDLALAQASGRRPDSEQLDGRSLRYWRGMWSWRNAEAALALPLPLVQVWGDADASVPTEAYLRFARLATNKPGGFCSWRMAGADHGLQSVHGDGLQIVWAGLERWASAPEQGFCSQLLPGQPL